VKEGGTMVEFGGFQMPVQYKGQSISDSVNWTRTKASLFDVHSRFALLIVGWAYATTQVGQVVMALMLDSLDRMSSNFCIDWFLQI
jgi:glycine cleavage system aminomethyltransferase T